MGDAGRGFVLFRREVVAGGDKLSLALRGGSSGSVAALLPSVVFLTGR